MKPLDSTSRRIIEDASAADFPTTDAQARIWQTLAQRLDAPLPPLAAAASRAIDAGAHGSFAAGLLSSVGFKALISAVVLASSAAVYVNSAPRSQPAARQPEVRAAPLASAPAVPAAIPQPAAAAKSAPQPPAPAPSLADETRLIAEAQRALSNGAPRRALSLTEQHRRRFPRGNLAPERDAAHVFALCGLGRSAEAEREQRRFLRNWPDSPLTARVRAGCMTSPEVD